ncbi:hypothetical protein AST00_01150 [Staphylococcus equorum]|uniref:hypothetical protein n=1 Tax=Staphylococcus TaxID=1279 RepID=UPI0008536911|nr:hypothetical protein [Staphylococcus equorum]OEK69773.1 hypothetical protein AST02_06690 [Staphylococcus equorum]OEK72232.1 hypothetical protein AST00_01150 [Staphylococcus equorum]
MKYSDSQSNTKDVRTIFLKPFPVPLIFIVFAIYTIITKDNTAYIVTSIIALIFFTSLLTLDINAYMNYKKQNKQNKQNGRYV